jgi:hypothetical protein
MEGTLRTRKAHHIPKRDNKIRRSSEQTNICRARQMIRCRIGRRAKARISSSTQKRF